MYGKKMIILFILIIIPSVYLITENQNTNLNSTISDENEDEYFVNDMSEEDFIKANTEPFNNFFNIEDGKNTYCELCKSGSDIILNTIIQEYKWSYLHSFCAFICSFALRKDICYEAVGRYGPIILENTFKRLFNKEKICTSLFICKPSIEYESVEEYYRRIFKTKNNNNNNNDKNVNLNTNKNSSEFNFIQVTDIHLQLNYKEGKVSNCNIPLCCYNTPEELGFKNNKNHKGEEIKYSQKYGSTGKCDGNVEVVKAFAKEAKKTKNEFILFTGDNSAHNVWEINQDEIIEATRISVELMVKELGEDIPIYPAIGNHEKAPPDVFLGSETVLLHGLSKIFRKYLTKEAYDSFSQFGYYTQLHKNTNLRIISLNCMVCNSMNFNLIGESYQPARMFRWLENVLNEAEKNNERVYLLDHIPMYVSQHTYDCTFRLKILIERYKDIISGYISGHTHRDEISLVKEYSNPKKYSLINYICPGLTTYTEYWPSYRIYSADTETKFINDFIQMRLNLDETNKNDKPLWFIAYQATKYYNVTKMDDYKTIAKANVDEIFVKHFLTDNPENKDQYTNPKRIEKSKCKFSNDNYIDISKCKNVELGPEFYLHYVLNILFAHWPKL